MFLFFTILITIIYLLVGCHGNYFMKLFSVTETHNRSFTQNQYSHKYCLRGGGVCKCLQLKVNKLEFVFEQYV